MQGQGAATQGGCGLRQGVGFPRFGGCGLRPLLGSKKLYYQKTSAFDMSISAWFRYYGSIYVKLAVAVNLYDLLATGHGETFTFERYGMVSGM